MNKPFIKRMTKTALCVCVTVVMLVSAFGTASATSLSEYRSKQAELSKNLKANQSKLQTTISDRNSVFYEAAVLDSKIEYAQNYCDYYAEMLVYAVALLEITEEELARARQEYNEQYEAFSQRVRYMNETDKSGLEYLQILLSSKSISDFINNAFIIQSLIEYDKNVADQLAAKEQYVAQKYAEAEELLREIESLKIEQDLYLQELELAHAEKQQRLEELYAQEEYYNNLVNQMQKEDEELKKIIKDAEAAELARQNAQNGTNNTQTLYVGGVLGWPVPSSTSISSPFGNRTHPITKKPDFHSGIDIPAPKGNDVVAAGNGTVSFVGAKGNYGMLVIVNHGGGIVTYYAHNSSIVVSAGQKVEKGQVIAKIGSTGQSTGNHLHFEVRVDNVPQNPINYVKGK